MTAKMMEAMQQHVVPLQLQQPVSFAALVWSPSCCATAVPGWWPARMIGAPVGTAILDAPVEYELVCGSETQGGDCDSMLLA